MQRKRLEWSKRAQSDRINIADYYAAEASPLVADEAIEAIAAGVRRILKDPLAYRQGRRAGTRECILRRFPFIIIYRVTATHIHIVRVLHQAAGYFN